MNSATQSGDAAQEIKDYIQQDPKFSEIILGKWNWRITSEGNGVYVADYGYWGHYTWGKMAKGILIEILTLGFYNPYPLDPGARSIYQAFRVDTINYSVVSIDKDPYLEDWIIDVEYDPGD